jgi:hypothetical protein
MTIGQLVSEKVALMDANGDSFYFLHSDKEWQNMKSDEADLPAVYLDMPVKYRVKTSLSGYKEISYIVGLMFLYKTELDDSPEQQEQTLIKAQKAQIQFEILLDNDADNVVSYTSGECLQIPHEYDADLGGVIMPLEITLRNNDSVCL